MGNSYHSHTTYNYTIPPLQRSTISSIFRIPLIFIILLDLAWGGWNNAADMRNSTMKLGIRIAEML